MKQNFATLWSKYISVIADTLWNRFFCHSLKWNHQQKISTLVTTNQQTECWEGRNRFSLKNVTMKLRLLWQFVCLIYAFRLVWKLGLCMKNKMLSTNLSCTCKIELSLAYFLPSSLIKSLFFLLKMITKRWQILDMNSI